MVFYLSKSSQLLEEPTLQSGIYTGRVIILEDSLVIYDQVAYIDSGFLYTTVVPKLDKNYEVILDIANFPLANAKDKVPNMLPDFNIEEVIQLGHNYQLNLKITDHPYAERYELQCMAIGKEFIGGDSVWTTKQLKFNSNDKIFLTNINSFRTPSRFALFTDDLFSSSVRNIRINVDRSLVDTDVFRAHYFVVQLSSLSEIYFDYILEIIENNHVYGGPLASDSYDAGNVDGGLGIFGAYTYRLDTIPIR